MARAKSRSAGAHKSYTLKYIEGEEEKRHSFNVKAIDQSATGLVGERLKEVLEIMNRPNVTYCMGAWSRKALDE